MYELTKLEYTRTRKGFLDFLPVKIAMVTGSTSDAGFFADDSRISYEKFMRLKKRFEKQGSIIPKIYKIRMIEEY